MAIKTIDRLPRQLLEHCAIELGWSLWLQKEKDRQASVRRASDVELADFISRSIASVLQKERL